LINFSANVSMLFAEVDFLERFERAAKAGFTAVEFTFPYAWDVDLLVERLEQYHLKQVLHNLPVGRWDEGERGIAGLPDRVGEFKDGVDMALRYARALKCPRLNCLAGLVPDGIAEKTFRKTLVNNLRYAAGALADENIQLLIEPLNNRDVPGFYLNRSSDALRLIEEVGHPNIKLQYDIYHMQIMEGDLVRTIQAHVDQIGHMQLADNPGRHQPGTGEINFPNLFKFIEQSGYDGWVGCEYIPDGRTEDTLAFLTLNR